MWWHRKALDTVINFRVLEEMPPVMVIQMNEICSVIEENNVQRKKERSKDIGESIICVLIYRCTN